MRKFQLALMMFAAVCLTVCAKNKKEVPEILFGVKSGVITISSDMGEMPDFAAMGGGAIGGFAGADSMFANFDMSNMVEKIYFDDYGRQTARVTISGDMETRTITKGDSTYTINVKNNTATVMPIFGGRRGARGGMGGMGGMGGFGMGGGVQIGTLGTIDWLNLDKKTIKRNKIKEVGEEKIAGVTCKKYTMRISSSMGFTTDITACIYQGIALQTQTESDWSNTSQTAVAFEENAQIDPGMFDLPIGCTVSERNFGGFGGMGGMGGMDFGGMGGMDFGGGGFGGGMGGFGGGFGGF